MIKKNKNNIISIAEMTLQGGGQDITTDTIANNSNEDLNKNIISIESDITNFQQEVEVIKETKADLYKWSTFKNYITEPDINENQTWIASTTDNTHYYNYSLPFLPDNGYYELRGMVQIEFSRHNISSLFLYNAFVNETLIGGRQPANCTGMALEQTLNTIVHNKTLILRTGTNPIQSGTNPTFRMYIRSYRKLYD